MILATLRDLACTLHCRPDQAEDVLRSEPSARAALSRRGLFKAAGAVAAGSAFGFAPVSFAHKPIQLCGISLELAIRFAMLEQLVAQGWVTPEFCYRLLSDADA